MFTRRGVTAPVDNDAKRADVIILQHPPAHCGNGMWSKLNSVEKSVAVGLACATNDVS